MTNNIEWRRLHDMLTYDCQLGRIRFLLIAYYGDGDCHPVADGYVAPTITIQNMLPGEYNFDIATISMDHCPIDQLLDKATEQIEKLLSALRVVGS